MARRYFSLAVRYRWEEAGVEHSRWSPEFGDYDREVVEGEYDDYRSRDFKARDLKIIATGEKQADINAGIAKLNNKGEVK
jgi:hypothetical protein